jgi:zinc protease
VAVPRLPEPETVERLANGLTLCLLRDPQGPQAPLVTTALWYRAGARDEQPARAGTAHFLEHMMFKGSPRFPAGELDQRTQEAGGANNAFTSHDSTAYYFSFAADRWQEALAMEADRMQALVLAPEEVESERRVILEEIAMYEDDPWDALEMRVLGQFFGEHPYGRPVLGTRESLGATGGAELADFHRDFYRPGNAVLVVAGDYGPGARDAVEAAFAPVPDRPPVPRPELAPWRPARERRLRRRKGDVARLLLALPAPAADDPDHARLRLLAGVLAGGRASRLHRLLVDELELCLGVSADLHETQLPGVFTVGAELLPKAEPERVEELVRRELEAVRAAPAPEAEVDRARQILLADWVFGHERVHQQALAAGFALALFDLDHPRRSLERLAAAAPDELQAAAAAHLDPEATVVGWSLPAPA